MPPALPRPPSRRHPRRGGRDGFTLVEMLAAMAVFVLLALMTAQLLRTAALTTANSTKHLNADGQARLVFDRMQMDLGRMLKRSDVHFEFDKAAGNDRFYFYSEAPGFFGAGVASPQQSDVSLIGYQVASHQLQRLGKGLAWSQVAFLPSTFTIAPGDADFHVLGAAVFRMEIAFLVRQDDTSLLLTDTPPAPGPAFQNLWAIVVAIAILDPDSQKIVSGYDGLVSALPDFTGSRTLSLAAAASPGAAAVNPLMDAWRTAVNDPAFARTAQIPAQAAAQVRTYQRVFSLK